MDDRWTSWQSLGFHVALFAVFVAFCSNDGTASNQEGSHPVEKVAGSKGPPYSFKAGEPGLRVVEFVFRVDEKGGRGWSVTAKDCLVRVVIDERVVFERDPEECAHCDRCNPVRVRLPSELEVGTHQARFEVKIVGEKGWLDVRQLRPFPWWGLIGGVGLVGLVLGGLQGLGRRVTWWQVALGAGAVVLVVGYQWATGPWTRQNDVGGHREYIEHLLANSSLPHVQQGWETHQPPLYYALTCAWLKLSKPFSEMDQFRLAQMLAGAIFLLTALVAIACFTSFEFSRAATVFGLAVFILLPAHVYLSAKINNDTFMPLWGTLVVVLGWDYWSRCRLTTLAGLAVVLLLAIMTKMTALSLVAAAGVVVFWREINAGAGLGRVAVRGLTLGLPAALWLTFWLARNWEQTGELLYVNSALPPSLLVSNDLGRYLSFDPSVLWRTDSIYASGIKASFPTALYGSLTTGDFGFGYLGKSALPVVRATLAIVVAVFLAGLVWRREWFGGSRSPWLPAVTVLYFHASFMLLYNLQYPYACNQDGRLWAPAFFAGCVVVCGGYDRLQQRVKGPWHSVLTALPWLFLVSVAVFYWQVITY